MTRAVKLVWICFFTFIGLFAFLLAATNYGWLGSMPSIAELETLLP
jgi:hypothetical protein